MMMLNGLETLVQWLGVTNRVSDIEIVVCSMVFSVGRYEEYRTLEEI